MHLNLKEYKLKKERKLGNIDLINFFLYFEEIICDFFKYLFFTLIFNKKEKMKILIVFLFVFDFINTIKFNTWNKTNIQNEDIKSLEGLLLYNYIYGDEKKMNETLSLIKELDKNRYERDKKIMDFWYYVDNKMIIYENIAPDDLPKNDHAFVVLGHKLKDDGSLSDEGKGRCDVAYESALKYPNSMIYVTGGGTCKYNKTLTEGGQMYDYLVNIKGLDPKRIIKEVSAMDTVENAKNTYKKLIEGNIKSITVITSEYHVRRGTLLFYGESLIYNEKNLTKPITIIKNAGYHTGNSPESKLMEGYSLALLMEVKIGLAIKEIIKDIFSFFFGNN